MIFSNLEYFARDLLHVNAILLFRLIGQAISETGASGGNEVVVISPRPCRYVGLVQNLLDS